MHNLPNPWLFILQLSVCVYLYSVSEGAYTYSRQVFTYTHHLQDVQLQECVCVCVCVGHSRFERIASEFIYCSVTLLPWPRIYDFMAVGCLYICVCVSVCVYLGKSCVYIFHLTR